MVDYLTKTQKKQIANERRNNAMNHKVNSGWNIKPVQIPTIKILRKTPNERTLKIELKPKLN